MADRPPPDAATVTEILRFAVSSLEPTDDPVKWRNQLTTRIPEVVAVFNDRSPEWDQVVAMFTATIIMGDFVSMRYNDSNHRVEVTVKSGERDPESFWSERTDTPLGAAQHAILRKIRKGDRVRVWKGLRQIDQTKKVRDLLHIQRLSADVSQPAEASASPPDTRPSAPAESPTGAASGGAAPVGQHSGVVLDYDGAVERLAGPDRVRLARWAHETMQVQSLYDKTLTADQKNTILAHCELIAQGMA